MKTTYLKGLFFIPIIFVITLICDVFVLNRGLRFKGLTFFCKNKILMKFVIISWKNNLNGIQFSISRKKHIIIISFFCKYIYLAKIFFREIKQTNIYLKKFVGELEAQECRRQFRYHLWHLQINHHLLRPFQKLAIWLDLQKLIFVLKLEKYEKSLKDSSKIIWSDNCEVNKKTA